MCFCQLRCVAASSRRASCPRHPRRPDLLLLPIKGNFASWPAAQQVGKEEFEISSERRQLGGARHLGSEDGRGHDACHRHARTPTRWHAGALRMVHARAQESFRVDRLQRRAPPRSTSAWTAPGPFTQQFTFNSPPIAILDNNLYHQYAVLGRLYDWNKKGAQTFSVLVPQEMTPGSVTVESLGTKDVDGKKLDELRVKTEDLELDLYLETSGLIRIDAPNANAEIVRE